MEGVRKGKGELYDFLRNNNGTVFINRDYDYLQTMSKGIPHLYGYGITTGEISGTVKKSEPFLEIDMKNGVGFSSIQTQLVGDYNLPNILCAVAAGKYFKIPEEKIKTSLEQYLPANGRSQMIRMGTNEIILDAYNANPSSMKAAIENFAKLPGSGKVLLLGGMMELGEYSLEEHQSIIQLIQQYTWKNVVLVGGDFRQARHPFIYFDGVIQAREWLNEQHFENTHLLVKGSRSMEMEKVLTH
jgi:UDP-N-acetylmuramoyl-tripeptide--D-alanyl-D-alanine ligase